MFAFLFSPSKLVAAEGQLESSRSPSAVVSLLEEEVTRVAEAEDEAWDGEEEGEVEEDNSDTAGIWDAHDLLIKP